MWLDSDSTHKIALKMTEPPTHVLLIKLFSVDLISERPIGQIKFATNN